MLTTTPHQTHTWPDLALDTLVAFQFSITAIRESDRAAIDNMGLHQRHTHGRVFRGEAARDQLAVRKRDSHGDTPIMHIPEGFEQKTSDDTGSPDSHSAVQVVYVTLSQTFAGPAIYSTLSNGNAGGIASSTAEPTVLLGKPIAATRTDASGGATQTSVATVSPASRTAATTMATAVSSGSYDDGSALESTGRAAQATQSSTSNSQATTEQSQQTGLSSGGKAGIAIGVILAIVLVCGLGFFILKKRKRASNVEALNEKHSSFPRGAPIGAAAATGAFAARPMQHGERESSKRDSTQTERVPSSVRSTRTASTAPRLSLRPITQLMTGFGEHSKGGDSSLDVVAAGGLAATQESSARERHDDPFHDATAPTNPFNENGSGHGSTATVNQLRTSWGGSEASTPSSAAFGTAAAVAVAGTGAANAAPQGPNNVHRVQLDFKPSMDDELELRSGQLVRMLHEYDDGWVSALSTSLVSYNNANNLQALCIRMDRSQQGVAPRTCLSKLPVKPRPQGPSGAATPVSRPGTAQSARGPPNAPGMMVPRPLTPTSSSRSPSPQEGAGRGGASTSLPHGPPRVQRKPVPGIAM